MPQQNSQLSTLGTGPIRRPRLVPELEVAEEEAEEDMVEEEGVAAGGNWVR